MVFAGYQMLIVVVHQIRSFNSSDLGPIALVQAWRDRVGRTRFQLF
jgi:hypothetical protein